MENDKSSVDNFLSWITSPLDEVLEFRNATTYQSSNNKSTKLQHRSKQTNKSHEQKKQPQTTTTTMQHEQCNGTIASNTTEQRKRKMKNNNNKEKNEKNPAEQFFNWLSSPPDRPPSQSNNKISKDKQQQQQQQQRQQQQVHSMNKAKKIVPANPNNKSMVQQQKQDQQQKEHPKPSISNHKGQLKNSDKIIPTKQKPDSLMSSSVFEACSTLELEVDLDPRPKLPSHIPTPDTIDDIIESNNDDEEKIPTEKIDLVIDYALDGIDGIHHRISNLLDSIPKTNNHIKKAGANFIKYAPSFETPPQSPVPSKKVKSLKSRLLLTPPKSSTKTKWGPEIWNAKKSCSTISLSNVSSSSSLSDNNNITTANSSIDFIIGDEININTSEWANQEKLLLEANEKKPKHEAAINKNKLTSANNIDVSCSKTFTTPTRMDINCTNDNEKKILCDASSSTESTKSKQVTTKDTTKTKTMSSLQQPSSPTKKKSLMKKSARTPLQLRWMYQNALNLQASYISHSGSFRICDGEAPLLDFVDEERHPHSSFREQQQRDRFALAA